MTEPEARQLAFLLFGDRMPASDTQEGIVKAWTQVFLAWDEDLKEKEHELRLVRLPLA
jgi:hypothetical protein